MPKPINEEHIITLKKKQYPVWAGVLDAATRDGLRSLVTRVIQIPHPDNGNVAIVMARAEFEDGRTFEDVGDCGPASTSPQLVAASIRLASTRAKGRALRDSQNVGQTMFEELPDLNSMLDEDSETGAPADAAQRMGAKPTVDKAKLECSNSECGKVLTVGQRDVSVGSYGRPLCPSCQKLERKAA